MNSRLLFAGNCRRKTISALKNLESKCEMQDIADTTEKEGSTRNETIVAFLRISYFVK